jgi:hypothetical protein
MRCVVEGDSPNEAAGDSEEEEEEKEEEEETKGEWRAKPGVVYRLVKGQLKVLDGGMRKYEAIATRASVKLVVLH